MNSAAKYYIYTDASFSHLNGIGVAGFLIFNGESANKLGQITEPGLRTIFYKESNNIRAEIVGVLHALKTFVEEIKKEKIDLKNIETNLFSDCQTLTNLLGRREKLIATDYISARKKTTLANAELYKEFFKIYDEIKPVIHWVKGHSKKDQQTQTQKNFQVVDKQVRKELRFAVSQVTQ